MSELKQRHGCVTFWLWLVIIANGGIAVFYAITMFDTYLGLMSLGFGLLSILGVANVLGSILLMRWNKLGFYLFLINSVLAIILNVAILKMADNVVVSSVFAVIVWWGILHIKQNGISAWEHMFNGLDYKHNRHLFQFFGGIIGVLFVLTVIAYNGGIDKDYDEANTYRADSVFVDEEDSIHKEQYEEDVEISSSEKIIDQSNQKEEEGINKAEMFLRNSIRSISLPIDAGSGISITKIVVERDFLVYTAVCDEELLDIDILNMNKNEVKDGIVSTITDKNDPEMAYVVKLCIKVHKGLEYRYIGDTSEKVCFVTIPYSELKDI